MNAGVGRKTRIAGRSLEDLRLRDVERRHRQRQEPGIGLDTSLKLVGLIGIGIYAILFVAYQAYYSVLGIHPEEIGVTQLFLLSRSIAFLILIAIPTAYVVGIVIQARWRAEREARSASKLSGQQAEQDKDRKLRKLKILASSTITLTSGVYLLSRSLEGAGLYGIGQTMFGAVTLAFGAAGFGLLLLWPQSRERIILAMVTITVIAAFIGAGIGLTREAREAATYVVDFGDEVPPITMLGLSLLDIETQRVEVSWVMPQPQRPTALFTSGLQACALLIGKSTSTVFLIFTKTGPQVSQLPISSVTIRRDRECDI
ncbi:hypothetical protein [Kribbella sp. NPDC003557]|uniref:hypothetical protein n=1 Tax=Kribbella sp. NPDC003557 TaxID=3154449 RepID=UPI0033B10E8D